MSELLKKSLHNPMAAKVVVITIVGLFLVALCASLLRLLRSRLSQEIVATPVATENTQAFAAAAYQGVILKLREDEKKLQAARQKEQESAAIADNINQTVLSCLDSGVLFFDRQGMVRQANRAAKTLLGYASPLLFHVRDLFRGVTRVHEPEGGDPADPAAPLVEALLRTLQDDASFPRMKIDYTSPGGQQRVLGITASMARMKNGEILGLVCVIDDLTEIADLSQRMERSESLASLGEISAGIVNDFNNSLATISGYAQMLVKEQSSEAAQQHARKIVAEAESLARIVGQFLEFAGSPKD